MSVNSGPPKLNSAITLFASDSNSCSWRMLVKILFRCKEANALNVKNATVAYSFAYVYLRRDRFHTLAIPRV